MLQDVVGVDLLERLIRKWPWALPQIVHDIYTGQGDHLVIDPTHSEVVAAAQL
jgi:hypothetical protein